MKKLIFVVALSVCSMSVLFANTYGSSQYFAETPPPQCTITIKGSYDGKPIDVTVTVTADNCARAAGELLKSFAQK